MLQKILNFSKLSSWLNANSQKLLWLLILVYLIIFFSYGSLKYQAGGYNGLDLGIYTNVFYNTVHGNWFDSSIHPLSYLGDHFELILLPLAIIYKLLPTPLTLLFLQALFLALAAWPLYLIAKKYLTSDWSLFIAAVWLLNPFVQNINLFEFHLLALAPFFIFWTYFYWQQQKFWPFLLLSFISLTVREDVALIIIMFGWLSLIYPDRWRNNFKTDWTKIWQWIILPIIIGGLWFYLANTVMRHYAPSGQYKFLYYYSWLGSSWSEIIINAFANPLNVLKHVFLPGNILMILLLLLPFLFLPLLSAKALWLALPILAQYLLSGGGVLILTLHYSALLLPPLFIALIQTWAKMIRPPQIWRWNKLFKEKSLIISLFSAATLYGFIGLGPITGLGQYLNKPSMSLSANLINNLPREAVVMATDQFLNQNLSNRTSIYLLRYWFWGKQQFAKQAYAFPPDTKYIAVAGFDILGYQQTNRGWVIDQDVASSGQRLRQLLIKYNFGCEQYFNDYLLLKRGINNNCLYELGDNLTPKIAKEVAASGSVKLLGYSISKPISVNNQPALPLDLFWQKIKTGPEAQLRLRWFSKENTIIKEEIYPLTLGFYPIIDWPIQQIVKTKHFLTLPINDWRKVYLEVSLVELEGFLTTDTDRSVRREIAQLKSLGPSLFIPISQ